MFTVRNLFLGFVAFIALLIGGCTGPTLQNGLLGLTCTATATQVSGTVGLAGAIISNLNVSISGGAAPYEITMPTVGTQTTSNSYYSYAGDITLTGSSSDLIQVIDTGDSNLTTSCSISTGGIGTTGSTLTITASPTSVETVGTPITLIATPITGTTLATTNLTYSFTLESGQNMGVNLISTGGTTATVTGTMATSATILVTAYEVGVGTAIATGTTTVTFTGSCIAGTACTTGFGSNISVSATPGNVEPVGTSITLSAYSTTGLGNVTYAYSVAYPTGQTNSGVNIVPTGTTTATVTSYLATTVTVNVIAYEAGVGTPIGSGQTTLTFTGSGTYPYAAGTAALNCTLGHEVGTYYVGSPVTFDVQSNTGEPVLVTAWNPGENWNGTPPTLPIPVPMSLSYGNPGQFLITVQAESAVRPGVFCNGGAPLYDLINVYPYSYY